MWKPKFAKGSTKQVRGHSTGGAMAHRRAVGGHKLVAGSLGLLVLAVLLVGSVYVSNRVTGLRTEIAGLESQREFLEAGSARLLSDWNKATAPAAIRARACKELVLLTPSTPDLVLVQEPVNGKNISVWRRWLDHMGGPEAAHAAQLSSDVQGDMVSLSPRMMSQQGER